jgi:hypothetical protein
VEAKHEAVFQLVIAFDIAFKSLYILLHIRKVPDEISVRGQTILNGVLRDSLYPFKHVLG